MSWRGKYTGWVRMLEEEYGNMIPNLTDMEIMELVDTEDIIYLPPPENPNPLPSLFLALSPTKLTHGIEYRDKPALEHFKNILRPTHTGQLNSLLSALNALDLDYKTMLQTVESRGKPETMPGYLTARLDRTLLQRILNEAEKLRRGGRTVVAGQTKYQKPRKIAMRLVVTETFLDQGMLREKARTLAPIYRMLTDVKTPRELLLEKKGKPRVALNEYGEFVNLLNRLRKDDLISPEERRSYDKRWRTDTEEREEILAELRGKGDPQTRNA